MQVIKKWGRQPGTLVRAKCCVCGAFELATGAGNHSRCNACKVAGLFGKSTLARYDCCGKDRAGIQLRSTVKAGLIPHASTQQCADCDGQAIEYEHRDYNKPLVVEPICRRCNLLRGPAIPRDGWLANCIAQNISPYRRRSDALKVFRLLGWATDVLMTFPNKLIPEHWKQLAAHLQIQPELATQKEGA